MKPIDYIAILASHFDATTENPVPFDSPARPDLTGTTKLLRRMATAACLLGLSAAQADVMVPGALTVGEGFTNPLGFHEPSPVFSWKLPDGVRSQSAYQIEVKTGNDTWNSDWVKSDQSSFVSYGGKPLASRQQALWRVRYQNESGTASEWSETARLELGLLSSDDWKARWIRLPGTADPKAEAATWLRRTFAAGEKVTQARLYVTARGWFEARLNGERVGSDFFASGWTPYAKRIDTLTYDVTGLVHSGKNRIGVTLGAGWYAGRLFGQKQPYGTQPELLFQLEITYADGSTSLVVSDAQWEGTRTGPIVASGLYDGETYDARRETSGWAPVEVLPDLGPASLAPKPFAPVRIQERLTTKAITEPESGRFVFDLGQNIVGMAKVRIPVRKDQTVTIRFAEMLQDNGTLYTTNYRRARSTDSYTAAADGTIEWEPSFTFHGFRYVELSGLPPDVKPAPDWVTGVVLSSDLRRTGVFASSHAKLNQLQSNITWGQRGNFVDIPTDCPQRDERLGWTGDAQVFCPTSLFNYDSHAFWKSWLASMRDEQLDDGRIPAVIPAVFIERDSEGWMDAATVIPWENYVRTGDRSVLADNFAMIEKLVGWYRAQSTEGLIPKINGYGDWLQPYARIIEGDTPQPLIATAYYAHSTRILADSARVLGRTAEEARYATEAETVKKAFARFYFQVDGKLQNAPETQTAYVLAIAFDLLDLETKIKAGTQLLRLVGEAGGNLRTGFLGTPLIAQALDDTGHGQAAYNLLFQETYPSWFYSIDQGATTMWERWNSYTRDKGFGSTGMNSLNHYAYGAIGQWMYERVAGLTPDPAKPGYRHFFVRPLIGPQLDWAKAELETPYGKAASSWRKQDGKLMLEIIVPPNTTATIQFPDLRADQTVTAGTHRYEIPLNSLR